MKRSKFAELWGTIHRALPSKSKTYSEDQKQEAGNNLKKIIAIAINGSLQNTINSGVEEVPLYEIRYYLVFLRYQFRQNDAKLAVLQTHIPDREMLMWRQEIFFYFSAISVPNDNYNNLLCYYQPIIEKQVSEFCASESKSDSNNQTRMTSIHIGKLIAEIRKKPEERKWVEFGLRLKDFQYFIIEYRWACRENNVELSRLRQLISDLEILAWWPNFSCLDFNYAGLQNIMVSIANLNLKELTLAVKINTETKDEIERTNILRYLYIYLRYSCMGNPQAVDEMKKNISDQDMESWYKGFTRTENYYNSLQMCLWSISKHNENFVTSLLVASSSSGIPTYYFYARRPRVTVKAPDPGVLEAQGLRVVGFTPKK